MTEEPATTVDSRRVRSFVGLVLGRLGPRAHGAASGSFLTLLVGEHTRSLFWVTFAITAHRFVTWAAHPIAGRLSDISSTRIGRRVPFMIGGLLAAGACTALYTHAGGYWTLVVLMVIARVAFVGYTLPTFAITPETFGGSRWLRAAVAVTIGGLVVGVSIRVTVIATWRENDPTSWAPAFYLAAGYIFFAALIIALLVRETPVVATGKRAEPAQWRATITSALQAPNARVLLVGLLLAVGAGGAYDRVYPIYARDALGAGADDIAAAGLALIAILVVLAPGSYLLAGRVPRKTLAVSTGLVWTVAALAHLWITELWQSVVVLAIAGAYLNGTGIALAALYLKIIPRRGGLGQRVGLVVAPILVAEMIARFASALAYDLIWMDYDVLWIITAALALPSGLVYMALRLPPWANRADLAYGRRTLQEILWGRRRSRRLFRGELSEDTDGIALLETLQDSLDPYTMRPAQTAQDAPSGAPY